LGKQLIGLLESVRQEADQKMPELIRLILLSACDDPCPVMMVVDYVVNVFFKVDEWLKTKARFTTGGELICEDYHCFKKWCTETDQAQDYARLHLDEACGKCAYCVKFENSDMLILNSRLKFLFRVRKDNAGQLRD